MSSLYTLEFLKALALTLVVETGVLLLIVRKLPLSLLIFASIIASALTLPYLWFVLPHFISNPNLYLLIGEIGVTLVEAVIYFFVLRLSAKGALFLSFICNLVSFLIGLLVQNLLH